MSIIVCVYTYLVGHGLLGELRTGAQTEARECDGQSVYDVERLHLPPLPEVLPQGLLQLLYVIGEYVSY
jgi:hypothetical protein